MLAGAASTALRDVLSGPPRSARVVGVHPSCVYLLAGSELLALETSDALGLPCAVRLAAVRADGPFAGVRRDDAAEVGDGLLRAGPVTVAGGPLVGTPGTAGRPVRGPRTAGWPSCSPDTRRRSRSTARSTTCSASGPA